MLLAICKKKTQLAEFARVISKIHFTQSYSIHQHYLVERHLCLSSKNLLRLCSTFRLFLPEAKKRETRNVSCIYVRGYLAYYKYFYSIWLLRTLYLCVILLHVCNENCYLLLGTSFLSMGTPSTMCRDFRHVFFSSLDAAVSKICLRDVTTSLFSLVF